MSDLARCMCGEIPESLDINGLGVKHSEATCRECGEWTIEFRLNYHTDPKEAAKLASEAWNEAPRDSDKYLREALIRKLEDVQNTDKDSVTDAISALILELSV